MDANKFRITIAKIMHLIVITTILISPSIKGSEVRIWRYVMWTNEMEYMHRTILADILATNDLVTKKPNAKQIKIIK